MSRSFDSAGRLTSQSGLGFTSAASYSYDANTGLKTAESLPLALGGALTASYSYYAGGRLATASTDGVSAAFGYDEAGNLVSEVQSGRGTTVFTYDEANRLTQRSLTAEEEDAAPRTTLYGWDTANAWRTS